MYVYRLLRVTNKYFVPESCTKGINCNVWNSSSVASGEVLMTLFVSKRYSVGSWDAL